MANQEVTEHAMADAGQASSGIQAVAPLSDGKVAFTDQTRRRVMRLERNGTVTVIAGTGVDLPQVDLISRATKSRGRARAT